MIVFCIGYSYEIENYDEYHEQVNVNGAHFRETQREETTEWSQNEVRR